MKVIAIAFLAAMGVAWAAAPEGKAVFETKCQACHGPRGEGKPAIAKIFHVEMPVFSSKEIQSKSDADFRKVITEGHGKMKPIPNLSDKQIVDVISYVRTLKASEPAIPTDGDIH